MFYHRLLGLAAILAVASWTIGCPPPNDVDLEPPAIVNDEPPVDEPPVDEPPVEEPATEEERIEAELGQLSPEDRALAEEQEVCLVSGQRLGSMGPPIKMEVEGHEVMICCPQCREPLLENPQQYLAEIGLEPREEEPIEEERPVEEEPVEEEPVEEEPIEENDF